MHYVVCRKKDSADSPSVWKWGEVTKSLANSNSAKHFRKLENQIAAVFLLPPKHQFSILLKYISSSLFNSLLTENACLIGHVIQLVASTCVKEFVCP